MTKEAKTTTQEIIEKIESLHDIKKVLTTFNG